MSEFTDAEIEAAMDRALDGQIEELMLQRRDPWHEVDPPCLCEPCESPAYGAPGRDHCAACCYGTLIEAYNHDCPVAEHREWAHKQFPLDRLIDDGRSR